MNRALRARLEGTFWLAALVAHVMAAGSWWWLRAGGFPVGHPRFWFDRVVPIFGLGWSLAGLVALHRERRDLLLRLLPAYPAAWAAGAISARASFPVTFRVLWLAPMLIAAALGVAFSLLAASAEGRKLRRLAILSALAWALVGAAIPWSIRPGPPGTRPLEAAAGLAESAPPWGSSRQASGLIRVAPGTSVYASEGSILAQFGALKVEVQPLLRFLSVSPDGCWVVFNRESDREGPEPRFEGMSERPDGTRDLRYRFPGLGSARLEVAVGPAEGQARIDAATTIDRPVDSHLNSFCGVEVRGHRRLFLEFSPCQGVRVEVLPFGYPSGRPLRFAFVDATRRFAVVEASSGEKGPFRTLAEGRLEPGDPLTITLHDEDRAAGRLTLRDWSAQLDVTPSPTAGWGAPANAIEFSLQSTEPNSPASIFVTLAATSVGRGWDCVGHAAGTYRNRLEIEH
ncbi:hypothetical protein [Aquisphaera insulae]|uniref:hypothetical protein n=1 Tax=Aquisphaera insulae TaxID=2712864 RepID=UPI0013EC7D09|nr:hypothetical protein [Aquisphaera insulae]